MRTQTDPQPTLTEALGYLEQAAQQLAQNPDTDDEWRALQVAAIASLHRADQLLQVARVEAIDRAREGHVSWTRMAEVFDVTPQAMQQRYGHRDPG